MNATTIRMLSEQWKADKRQYVKASSYSSYLLLLNKHILPCFGEASSVSEDEVQAFVLRKLGEGLSVQSVRELVLILKMIVRLGAKTCGWPTPDWALRYPREQAPAGLEVLTKQDHRKILEYIKTHFTCRNLGIMICLSAGLRIGELCALQWKDLDTEGGVIRVNKTLGRVYLPEWTGTRSHILIGTPKTPNASREVPMSRDLLRLVKPLTKMLNPDYYVLSNDSKPLEPKTYRLFYKSFMSEIGMPELKFHGLRHSFATRCIESGCDYKTVSVLLGHSNIGTTLNLYVHPNLDQKKRCIDRFANALR